MAEIYPPAGDPNLNYGAPAPKKSNTALIIGIVIGVLLLCCCCTLIGAYAFGDPIMSSLGFY